MNDPNITMAEYIQLGEEKAHRHGQEFNWETATHGKVRYSEDIDYFKDFENQFPAIVYNDALTSELEEVSSDFENGFPAIVYNDALTSEPEVSSEPMSCWNPDKFTTHILAHILNMKNHTEQISREFLVLIL
ncbi:hypothetical protein Tco_0689601 [Tanacetum coccineum]